MRIYLAAFLAVWLVGCGGGGSSSGDGGGGEGGSTGTGGSGGKHVGGENGSGTLLDLAHSVYDALGSDEAPVAIGGAHVALGIPLIGDEQVEALDPRAPFLLEPQLLDLVAAFEQGSLVSVDSFFADLADHGVKMRAGGEPLSRDSFATAFAHYKSLERFDEDQALFAFVFALGEVRAELLEFEQPDPLWGDGKLDPLQFSLLAQAIAAAEPSAEGDVARAALISEETGAKVNGWGMDKIKGQVEDVVESAIEVPITPEGGIKSVICASLLIYGHKLEMKVVPNLIWHKQESGDKPALAEGRVKLTFQDDYYDKNYPKTQKWLIENAAGCKLPTKGAAPGMTLTWKTGKRLQKHGDYDIKPSETNAEGEAVATWRSVAEQTPQAERKPENVRTTADRLYVEVRGLVPGWKNLERGVAFTGADNALYKDDSLTVNWYQADCTPGADLASMQDCRWSGSSQVAVHMPLGTVTIRGDVTFVYASHDDKSKKVTFKPEGGTAFVSMEGEGLCSPRQDRENISPSDGELVIDYSKDPPTYEVEGITQWDTTIVCPGGHSYQGPTGGVWMGTDGQGGFEVSEGGRAIVSAGSADGFSWEWDLRRR